MKSRKHDGPDDAAPVATPPQEVPAEERGLAGVDAAPVPALTREEIEALRRERDELREQLLRKRAEFENYRKRVERDRQQAGVDAAAAVLKGLVPTLDNLDRALRIDRHPQPTGGGNTTPSNNPVACACDGGRRIRVSRTTLGVGPIVCQVCGTQFDPH